MTKSQCIWIIIIVAVILIAIVYYIHNKEPKENQAEHRTIVDELKSQLNDLQDNHTIDSDVKGELLQIEQLLNSGANSKAMLSVGKVIENYFRRIYKKDSDFKTYFKETCPGRNKPDFQHYLNYAKKTNFITEEQFLNISSIKQMKNKESHELNLKMEMLHIISFFSLGFNMILWLSVFLYGKQGDENIAIV